MIKKKRFHGGCEVLYIPKVDSAVAKLSCWLSGKVPTTSVGHLFVFGARGQSERPFAYGVMILKFSELLISPSP
jgi:hypothetical protein